MTRRAKIAFWLSAMAFVAVGASLFAEELGLDPSAGWGIRRIALLATGVGMLAGAAAYWRYGDELFVGISRFHVVMALRRRVARLLDARRTVRLRELTRDYWFAIPLVLFILIIYVWFVSSGSWTTWDSPTHYYADLTRGFARGKLYLAVRVDPGLLASPNPYQPMPPGEAPGPLDLSLYRGRFYLYWGPVPAVLLLLMGTIVHGRVGDLQLVFAFTAGVCILQGLFLVSTWNRWFKVFPRYLLWLSVLVTGLVSPATFMLNNHQGARIYEAAIMGGQFFLLGGFLATCAALGPPVSRSKLLLAGGLWGLGLGTRLNLAIPVSILVLLTLAWIVQVEDRSGRKLLQAISLCAPVAMAVAGLGWYNWARFGSITQSGLAYQLTGVIDLREHYREIVSPLYMPPNLYNYLLNPFGIRSEFPFLHALFASGRSVAPSYPIPELYSGQQITGMVYTVPFVVFAIIPLVRGRRHAAQQGTAQAGRGDHEGRVWNWTLLSLSLSSLAAFGVLLVYFWSAMRFLADFMPSLSLLSVMGFWLGYEGLSRRPVLRKWYVAAAVILAAASVIASTLVAISINDARFAIVQLLSGSK